MGNLGEASEGEIMSNNIFWGCVLGATCNLQLVSNFGGCRVSVVDKTKGTVQYCMKKQMGEKHVSFWLGGRGSKQRARSKPFFGRLVY